MKERAGISLLVIIAAISLLTSCAGPGTGTDSKVQPAATPSAAPKPSGSKPVQPSGGTIQVNSTPPGAAVLLISSDEGGAGLPEPKGASPVTITGVAPGKYTVHLEKSGYRYFQKEVQVKEGSSITVNANLKKG